MAPLTLDSLTHWDWLVLIIAGFSVGFGLWRGLIRTVFALAAWVVALLATPWAGAWVFDQGLALTQSIPPWVTYLACFLGLFVAVRVVGALLVGLVRRLGMGLFDRLLGGALGAGRAALVLLVVAVAAHAAGLSHEPAWQEARSRPLLDAMVDWAQPYLPESVRGFQHTRVQSTWIPSEPVTLGFAGPVLGSSTR